MVNLDLKVRLEKEVNRYVTYRKLCIRAEIKQNLYYRGKLANLVLSESQVLLDPEVLLEK